MPSGTRGLYLQIGGNVDNLQAAAKAGKSILAQFGADAVSNIQDIEQAFQKLGGGGDVEQSARALQQTYSRAFAAIRANAQNVANAPTGSAALGIVNATAAGEAADAAERQAAGLRLVADAAARAAASTAEDNVALKTYAVAAAAQATGAERQAAALRSQAAALGLVHGELVANGEVANDVVEGNSRMGASGLILEHVVRSTVDSFNAGLPPAQIFGEQIARLGEAAALSGGELGAVGAFLTSGWGLALTAAVAVLAPMIPKLFEADDAAKKLEDDLEKAATSADSFGGAQSELGKIIDLTTGRLKTQNEVLIQSIRLQAQAAQLAAQAKEKTDAKALQGVTQPTLLERADAVFGAGFGNPYGGDTAAGDRLTANQRAQAAQLAPLQSVLGTFVSNLQALKPGESNKAVVDAALAGVDKLAAKNGLSGRDPLRTKQSILALAGDKNDELAQQQVQDAIDGKGIAADLKPYEKPKTPKKRKVDHSVEHEADKDRAYQAELNTAQSAYAKAQLALADTAEGRLKVETDDLQAALKQRLLEIDDQVTAKKINDAQAGKLKKLAVETEALQEIAARRAEESALLDQAFGLEKQQLDAQIALLSLNEELATSRRERIALEKQILADQQKERRDNLAKTIADPKASETDKINAVVAVQGLPAQEAAENAALQKKNQGPLASYKDQLRSAVGDTNQALQGVGVDTFKGIEDGFQGVISGTETVAGAFKKMSSSIISDIARIVIERAILAGIGPSTGGAAGGGAGGGIGGFFASIFGHADGGHITGPGTGRSDSILARLSNGEFVVNAAATARHLPLLHALNDNSMPAFADGGVVGSIPYMRDLSAADMRDVSAPAHRTSVVIRAEEGALFRPVVHSIAGGVVQETAPHIVAAGATAAKQESIQSSERRLGRR